MTISVFDAAHRLCEQSNWSLSNLKLQKLIYIAHLFHLGKTGEPLIQEHFEAWEYGPVQPDLYHTAKIYGSSPVKSLFHKTKNIDDDSLEAKYLDEAYKQLSHHSSGWLVAVTHSDKGAWSAKYVPGVKGIIISNEDILNEYRKRVESHARKA